MKELTPEQEDLIGDLVYHEKKIMEMEDYENGAELCSTILGKDNRQYSGRRDPKVRGEGNAEKR